MDWEKNEFVGSFDSMGFFESHLRSLNREVIGSITPVYRRRIIRRIFTGLKGLSGGGRTFRQRWG